MLLVLVLLVVQHLIDLEFRSHGLVVNDTSTNARQHSLIQNKTIESTGFAVVINTYKRPDMLRQAIQHYGQTCGLKDGVRQIFVVWAESDDPPTREEVISKAKGKTLRKSNGINDEKEVVLEFLKVRDSLNSRFLPIPNLVGDAVFMVDDG